MIELVARGPRMVAVRTARRAEVIQELQAVFTCELWSTLRTGINPEKIHCLLCVVDENGEHAEFLAIQESVESVLCGIIQMKNRLDFQVIRALPQMIIFNSLGNSRPVLDKIQQEIPCERIVLEDALHRENHEGILVMFLKEDDQNGRRFYEEALLADYDYGKLMSYLKIHAPRYLAKAFQPDEWHMVDLRIYDRYEAYNLQYKRITEAIKAMKLGYLVTETWNREVRTFEEPVGTYHIRLLTFLKPLQLKKYLIGLEYSRDGYRVVDLDLIWHNKKISWKDLLDDKETRKTIKKTKDFFPKSSFFAAQNDKAALIRYCIEELEAKMPEDTKEILKQYEQQISGNMDE